MEIEPDTRVMDLGCGKTITSIFLAQEFHLQVWATDLWVSAALPHQNLPRGFAQLAVVGSAEILLAEFGGSNGP